MKEKKTGHDCLLPLATSTWGPEEELALSETLASGRLTYGEKVAAFEDAAAKFFGSKHCVMVNSGSSANLLALAAALEVRKDIGHDGGGLNTNAR